MSSFLSQIASAYRASVAKHPLATNSTLGFIIAGLGDVLCQKYMEERDEMDWRRTFDMAIIRFAVMSPFLHVYFPNLAKTVPGNSFPRVLARVGIDQLVGSPISISLTFAAVAVMQGNLNTLPQRLTEQLPVTWQTGATYWPFVHGLNFKYVPVPHQALVAHVASVYWNAVLSYRANLKAGHGQAEPGGPAAVLAIPSAAVGKEGALR